MQSDDMMQRLLSSPTVRAALHHPACGSQAERVLREHGLDPDFFQLWGGLGRAVLDLFSARRCIGAVGCETAGMATMVVRDFRHALLAAICESTQQHMVFASTQPESERSSQATLMDIAYRLVGAVAYERGLYRAVCDFLDPTAATIRAVKVSKDTKTVLQELLQAQRYRPPVYEVVASSGPDYKLKFEVRVTTQLGASALGTGASKKAAELAAASNLLRDRYPSTDIHHNIRLRPNFDVPSAVDSIDPLPNGAAAVEVCAAMGLPPWSAALISLSMVHRSRALQTASKFGRDNSLLAFLGSHVIGWAAKDHCIRRLAAIEIIERTGLQNVSAFLFSYSSLIPQVEWLYRASLPIARKPEDLAPEGVRKEFLQALLGAVFLASEQAIHVGDDAVSCVPGLKSFWESAGARMADRKVLLPTKTVLQEKLQAVGIEVQYRTQDWSEGRALVVRPRLQLQSPYFRGILLISGQTRSYPNAHEREQNAVLESELAERLNAAYTFVAGSQDVDSSGELPADIAEVRAWLFNHFRHLLNNESVVARDIQSGKLLRGFPMGIEFLAQQDLNGFGQWFRRSLAALNGWPSYLRDLTTFYGAAGYSLVGDRHRTSVLSEVDSVAGALRTADPLTETNVMSDTSERQRLTDLATLSKLRSAEVVQIRFDELAEHVNLLYRTPIELRSGGVEPCLAERRGAHLVLVGLILDSARAESDRVSSLIASTSERGLTLQVNKVGATSDMIQARLESRLLWRALVTMMGIDGVKEDAELWSATLPSVVTDDALSHDILHCWWTFNGGGSLAAATDGALATLLHDVKNEMLAYRSAASQARNAARHSERYALAASASRHAEQALSRLDVVRGLMSSARTKTFTAINLSSLFRSMTNDTLSWLPSSVHLEMPKVDSNVSIETDEDTIRSLLANLVRNAFEALPASGGSIGIEYLVDEDAGQVEFEVRDSGPGFQPEQLEALNRGEPVSTTKLNGSGLGLLTVLILINSLGGRATFKTSPDTGSRVLLRIPMQAAEVSSHDRAIDTNSPIQEVRFT